MDRRHGLRCTVARLTLTAVWAVLFLAAGPVWAGAISGTVTDAGTSAALTNVTVWVYDAAGSWAGSATTGVGGGFTVSGLADGVYHASTWNDLGYVNELYDDIPCLA